MKNYQKGLALLTALLLKPVFADGAYFTTPCIPCNYFYAGINLGAISLTDYQSTNNPITDKHNLGGLGGLGGVLAGYEFALPDQYNLGLEAFYNKSNLDISANQNYSPVTSYTVKLNYNAGLRLIPGFAIIQNGLTAHAIIGYSYANFSINDNGNYGLVNSRFGKSGIQFGIGGVVPILKKLSIRSDIIYSLYHTQTTNGVTTSTPPATQVYKNRFATFEGNLALIYNFA